MPSPPLDSLDISLVDTTIAGKYRIDALLAHGGMSSVYRATQLPLGRSVALKVLRPPPTEDAAMSDADLRSFQKRFTLEASTLSRLQHPNIVSMFDYGKVDNTGDETCFIAMEFVAGETLLRVLKTEGRLDCFRAISVARQVARALRAAHAQKVIHRDLKPSNIMLTTQGGEELVKVVDFGIVKVLSDNPEDLTRTGMFVGSPSYMPPEQVRGLQVDLRADVYALGIILYQMIAGELPFRGASVDILAAHLTKPPPKLREQVPELNLPEEIESFVLRCLAKKPNERPDDMDELLHGLVACEEALERQVALGSRTSHRPTRPPAELEDVDSSAPTVMREVPVEFDAVPGAQGASAPQVSGQPFTAPLAGQVAPLSAGEAGGTDWSLPPWWLLGAGLALFAALAWILAGWR